jgi:tetratricopeptide (TPR) repeat protein
MSSGMSFPQIVKNQETSFTEAINLHVAGSEESREQFLQTAAKMAQIQIPPDFTASQKQAIAQAINDLIISARQEIDRSYPDYKQDVRALSIFGMFYNIIGDSVSAQKVLEEALVISPYKQITAFDLVRAYLTQKKYPEAHALAKKEFLSAPLFDNALKLYVICAIYDGHFDEIQGVLTSVNRQLPIDGDTINALVDTKQFDKAIEILNALKQNQPTSTGQVDAYIKQILAKKAVN